MANNPFISTLIQLLTGTPAMAQAGAPRPSQVIPAGMAEDDMPETTQVDYVREAPRPATLPGGTFTPQGGPEEMQSGPLAQLFGPNLSKFIRTTGAGMSNIRGNPYGDPFITAAQGFGGATEFAGAQDAAAAKAAADRENLMYERETGEAKTQREIDKDASDLRLRELAEARQQTTADLTNKKTALEIRREARQNGITVKDQLEIERIAQAAGENLYGEEREKAIQETRDRLVDQFTSGQGITGKGGGLSSDPTATNPETGEQMVYRNGAWGPM